MPTMIYDFSCGVPGNQVAATPEPASRMLPALGVAVITGFRRSDRMKG
jgi:hypothetical protein